LITPYFGIILIEKTDIDIEKASNYEIVNEFIIEHLDDWDDEEII